MLLEQAYLNDSKIWWPPQLPTLSLSLSMELSAFCSTYFKHRRHTLSLIPPLESDKQKPTHRMDSIAESCTAAAVASPAKILVGVSFDATESMELLSWALGVVARPNDAITALHVLAVGKEKEEKRLRSDRSRLRQAKAFVISIVAELAEMCQVKQVKLDAKVRTSFSIGKGLTDEAALLGANFLLLRRSRIIFQRNSFEILKYCMKHSPQGCSVIGYSIPCKDSDIDKLAYDDNHSSASKLSSSANALSSLHKFFASKSKGEKRQSVSESICENSSPRAVLYGPEPEGESPATEDLSSPSGKGTSRRSNSNIWRRLSVIKLLFPSFSSSDLTVKDADASSSYFEDQKPSWRCFSYEEIANATNNFHPDNIVGRGGYAEVFRGELYDGQSVAIKMLARGNASEQKEKEFLSELGILGHVCHPNTTYLIGCCIENGLHLVFDLSSNGNLGSALHGKNGEPLSWPVRYKIALGIARGLHYLHKCCRRRIIHRDIKASNILLGPNYEPQISDFGLAKWLPKQWTHHSVAPIEGTFGYLAPEYFMHGVVDEKTDVFAFGVLLLEIVSGRRPVDSTRQSLLVWATPLIESGRIAELVDPKLAGKYDRDQMRNIVLVASYCIRRSPMWRPSMSEVMQFLGDNHHGSTDTKLWRMPECQVDEMDDCDEG